MTTTDLPEPDDIRVPDTVLELMTGVRPAADQGEAAPAPAPAPAPAEPVDEEPSEHRRMTRTTKVLVAAIVAVFAVTLTVVGAAFALSFDAIADVARLAGVSGGITWLMPVCIDGAMIVGTVAWQWKHIRGRSWRQIAYPASVVLLGSIVSVWLNAIHARLHHADALETATAMVVSALPAAFLAVCVHLVADLVADLVPRSPNEPSNKPYPQASEGANEPGMSPPTSPQPEPAVSPTVSPTPADNEPRPEPRRARRVSPQVSAQGSPEAQARKWILSQLRAGKELTGAMVAERFKVHPSSGKRWLKAVRDELNSST